MPRHTIEFWFDFSSPYAYFAAQDIDDIGSRADADVAWRPFLLGAAFQVTGVGSLSKTPIRGDYARHDWARLSRQRGIPFRLPANHPYQALAVSRAYYWLEGRDPAAAKGFARAAFRAHFVDNVSLIDPDTVANLAARYGGPRMAALAAIDDPEIKATFKARTQEALSKGVFGSPFFIADGEPFWGQDRMAMMIDWLQGGGW